MKKREAEIVKSRMIRMGLEPKLRHPLDTARKLNVHKTFRRRPERLLNVLCTFNIRPVSAA